MRMCKPTPFSSTCPGPGAYHFERGFGSNAPGSRFAEVPYFNVNSQVC